MKKDENQKINSCIHTMRQLHKDISLLLQTAEEMVADEKIGWKSIETKCTALHSTSINKPERWMPHFFFRIFKIKNAPSSWGFISVTFDDVYGYNLLKVPLASVGIIEYEDGTKTDKPNEWDASAAHWLPHTEKDYGRPLSVNSEVIKKTDSVAEKITFVCHPLAVINCTEELRKSLIMPLKRIVGEFKD